MLSQKVVFRCTDDIHMKAVAVLIQKASGFHSRLSLQRDNKRVNAKSLLGVMSLGIENGMEFLITADGDDEQEALAALVSYMENPNFD